MTSTLPIPKAKPTPVTDAWVAATWDEFLAVAQQPEFEKSRTYYDDGYMRIETMGIGSAHAQDNTILLQVVSLYGTLKSIRIKGFTNASFRKPSERECQPDLAFYIGDAFQIPPKTSQPVDVTEFGAPQLAIEVASTTLNDDLGRKRLLYERLAVQEYWVVDVEVGEVIAFAVAEGGSKQIQDSQILPGLALATVEEALKRGQTEDDGEINRWLIQVFSGI